MAAPLPEQKILIGSLLVGKYRVTREIGRGGMAAVYEAEHIALGKKVAIKVLASELASSAIVIERFFREARAAASVKSPYIVEVYDSGRLEDGRPFIAMEYLEGESLYDRMARVRLIDPATTVRVITQCAKGLVKAHAAGIVHRDLKPENIHLTKNEDGEEIVKILDFGLAKFYAPVKTDEKTARLTREGAVFGTPAYMSPEQVKGQGSVDHRADLWALGCMAFECLTGRPVWNTDQGVAMTFAAIAAAQPPVPTKLRPDLPPAFDDWFRRALERDVTRRFQSAKELADALQMVFDSPPSSTVKAAPRGTEASFASILASAGAAESADEEISTLRSQPMLPPPAPPPNSSPRPPGVAAPPSAPVSSGPLSPPRLGPPHVPSVMTPKGAFEPQVRELGLSATDLPPLAGPETPAVRAPSKRGPAAYIFSLLGLGAAAAGGFWVWTNILRPQVFTPVVVSTVTAIPPLASSTETAAAPPTSSASSTPLDEAKWMATLAEGQRLLSLGDGDGALKRFKEAQEQGGGAIAKAFLDQVKVGLSATGPCKLVGFSHPRMGYGGSVGRPSIAMGSKGAVVVWTDDHEQAGHDHAYSVVIDPTGRPLSAPRDLTPEADYVMRPALLPVDDRFVLLYWDKSGREAGVRVRWLDSDGRIGGASVLVGAARPGAYWPSIDRIPTGEGGFIVAWQDERDRENEDLFLRRLNAELTPLGSEIRATDYVAEKPGKSPAPQIGVPSVAVAPPTTPDGVGNVFVAYALQRNKQRLIERMRIALNSPELVSGLEERPPQTSTSSSNAAEKRKDREIGDVTIVNEDRVPGDYPSIACTKDGCYLVWHRAGGGANVALIDPVKGIVLWRKRFAGSGGHPSLGVSPDGQVQVAYYEGGRVRVAGLSRDGVGTTTTFAKVSGDPPRPWIASGRSKGEWYVGWLDYEDRHTEAYVARLACRN